MTTFKPAISNTFLWNPELGIGQAWKPGKRNGSTWKFCYHWSDEFGCAGMEFEVQDGGCGK